MGNNKVTMELKEYKLGDLLEVTRGASLAGEYYATEGKYKRITLGNFNYKEGGFKEDKQKDDLFYVGEIDSRFILHKGDILTPLTEQALGLLGSTIRIPEDDKYIQSQDVALLTCNEKLLDKDFCYYLIPSKMVRQQLSAAAQQTSIRHTSPDKIKACKVYIPELAEQKKIAKLLRLIEDKINLNRQINRNLEALAKQIYDYWFVQFDFPDENGKPYKSNGGEMLWNEKLKREIPKGWEGKPLKECISHINTGLNPRDNFTFGGDIRYITVKNLTADGIIDYSSCDFIDSEAREKVHKRSQIQIGDILYASICPLGRTYLITNTPDDWDINESVFSIRPNSNIISSIYLNMLLKDSYYITKLTQSSTGSIFQGIRIHELERTIILVPNKEVIDAFSNRLLPLIKEQNIRANEITALIKQRDELLPLLMNGQLNSDLFAD